MIFLESFPNTGFAVCGLYFYVKYYLRFCSYVHFNFANSLFLIKYCWFPAAGIPDFRSPGSGLYHNLEKYDLPDPLAIFELDFFCKNPKPFFALAKELFPGRFKPTKSHYFIRLLHEKGYLLRHLTQNIDTLERVAGIPEEKIVEAHGSFHQGHCLECKKEYSLEWMKGTGLLTNIVFV